MPRPAAASALLAGPTAAYPMKTYRTASSDEGLRFPHSGFIIGRVADALRLKAMLRDVFGDSGYKSAQRYFSGVTVEQNTVDALLDSLVHAVVPAALRLPPTSGVDEPFQTFVSAGVKFYARAWDSIAARANSLCFPVSSLKDLPIPALRLLVLDLGLRWGAWTNLQVLQGAEPSVTPWWIDAKSVGTLIDRWRDERGLSLEDLAGAIDVSVQALASWRCGEALPTASHIEALARALSAGPEDRTNKEYLLRLVVGVQSLRRDLIDVCGRERIDDMVSAMIRTAQIVHDSFVAARNHGVLNDDAQAPRLWNIVFYGARCPAGEPLAMALAERAAAWRPEVSADFAALASDWEERIHYWMKFLATIPDEIENLRRHNREKRMLPDEEVERIGASIAERMLRMADFDWDAARRLAHTYRVSGPPEMKAANRASAADRALSLDDLDGAIKHLQAAVEHSRLDPALHLQLGAALGIQGLRAADREMMERGVLECRLAYQLDPALGNARNEIGIILANMRRHTDAEVAFAEAEPYHGLHAHHWFARADNHVALGQLDKARVGYQKAIELTKDGMHVLAMARLAAVLTKLGRAGEAGRLAKRVRHLVGEDPIANVDAVLDIWRGNPFSKSAQ